MELSSYFTSSSTNKNYPVQGNMNCDSSNVVYKFKCDEYIMDYIGKPKTNLRFRTNNRISS